MRVWTRLNSNFAQDVVDKESVWLSDVACRELDRSIYTCPNSGWDTVDGSCSKRNYAGVQCFGSGTCCCHGCYQSYHSMVVLAEN